MRHRVLEAGAGLIAALNAPGTWPENLHYAFPDYHFGTIKGTTYYKIFKNHPGSEFRSVVAFVKRKTGEIFLAKSWKQRGRKIGAIEGWRE